VKLAVLIENTSCDPSLKAEHGLSLYIETGNRRLLFDTGATGAFADNAVQMGIDLSEVDALILSHGHYDHGGGVEAFLERNASAEVYLSSHAFGEHYNGAGKYIGLPQHLRDHPRLIPVTDSLTLAPGITLDCCRERAPLYPGEPFGLQIRKNGLLCPETFDHELYLTVQEERRICFSGCAHRGVENIVHWLAPQVLIGGFHFKQLRPGDPRLDLAARRLLTRDCEYYTCHCTGQEQYDAMKQTMGNRLHYLSTGNILLL
jgi:7,8-dihydropterin-6-yl-methyl-4-(beta-D-ribofuranosyl)aminobenzene 5'-phosphate synthase